jgi:hypothetical protein
MTHLQTRLLVPTAIMLSAGLLAVALRPGRYQFATFSDGLVLRADSRSGEAQLCRPVRAGDGYYLGCWTPKDGYRALLRTSH